MEEQNIVDFEKISRIKVSGLDEKITNQDARKVFVADKDNEYRRTSDFLLGNDDKDLDNGEYINTDEFLMALEEAIDKEHVEKIVMKKTGKKVKPEQLQKIVEQAKKAGTIVLGRNEKIKNQEAKLVSVKTPNMQKEATVAGMMLGKNGVKLADGDYVKKEELEFDIVEKKVVPVIGTEIKNKQIKIMKGLSTVAVATGLIALLPFIMHANSVMWHQVGPGMQEVLHSINLGLGKLVSATYQGGNGLWNSAQGFAMNSDAATSSLMVALATYGVTGLGLTKIINDIKNGVIKAKELLTHEKTTDESIGGKTV